LSGRTLIVNADDLGFVPSVTRGILESMEAGIVRSASLMVNMPLAGDAVTALARLTHRGLPLGAGLHFNIVVGSPLVRGTSLETPRTGAFHPLTVHAWRAWRSRLDLTDVERELRAQLELAQRWLGEAGMSVTHIDSHRHTHCLPGVYELVLRVAREFGVPHVRQPVESTATLLGRPRALLATSALRALVGEREPHDDVRFSGVALMRSPTFHRDLERLLDALPPGATELMVHPGYDSPELAAMDGYRAPRERELRALTSPALRERLSERGIALAHFGAKAPAG
jgi:chitin disaccharide deacetylase